MLSTQTDRKRERKTERDIESGREGGKEGGRREGEIKAMIRLRFDSNSTALYAHSTSDITTCCGLLHLGIGHKPTFVCSVQAEWGRGAFVRGAYVRSPLHCGSNKQALRPVVGPPLLCPGPLQVLT